MDETFIRKKIDELRLEKNLSERKLSKSLGKNESYINSVSNGKYLPSWIEFFYLCDFFEITPSQFFDESGSLSLKEEQAIAKITNLDEEMLEILLLLLNKLQSEK